MLRLTSLAVNSQENNAPPPVYRWTKERIIQLHYDGKNLLEISTILKTKHNTDVSPMVIKNILREYYEIVNVILDRHAQGNDLFEIYMILRRAEIVFWPSQIQAVLDEEKCRSEEKGVVSSKKPENWMLGANHHHRQVLRSLNDEQVSEKGEGEASTYRSLKPKRPSVIIPKDPPGLLSSPSLRRQDIKPGDRTRFPSQLSEEFSACSGKKPHRSCPMLSTEFASATQSPTCDKVELWNTPLTEVCTEVDWVHPIKERRANWLDSPSSDC